MRDCFDEFARNDLCIVLPLENTPQGIYARNSAIRRTFQRHISASSTINAPNAAPPSILPIRLAVAGNQPNFIRFCAARDAIGRMIELNSPEKLQNAINNARARKPRVRVIVFGVYSVTNKTTGATYTVRCERRGNRRFAGCNCKAGQRDLPCYHLAAAVGVHIQLASERAARTV